MPTASTALLLRPLPTRRHDLRPRRSPVRLPRARPGLSPAPSRTPPTLRTAGAVMTEPARWHDFAYVQTDIPAGMTIRDWRAWRAANPRASRRWWRLMSGIRARAMVGVRQVVTGALAWRRGARTR